MNKLGIVVALALPVLAGACTAAQAHDEVRAAPPLRLRVFGLTCAACSARASAAIERVPGAKVADAGLIDAPTLSARFTVEGSRDAQAMIAALETAGYGARLE